MSKKILIITSVLMVLGIGLIPTGIFINDYIQEKVANSIDEGLLGIEEDAIPLIEPMIKEKGIPQTLRGIREQGITVLEDMVEATFVAVLIELMAITGGDVLGNPTPPIGIENFFNNNTGGVWFIFSGVSQYHGEPLNYTEDAQNRILFGNSTTVPGYIPGIQGLLNDTSTGAGVLTFLDQYYAANVSTSEELNQTMQENYNCTWYQLIKLHDYINIYLIDLLIPIIIANNLHVDYMPELAGLLSINDIANALLMEQWANGTILGDPLYPGGIDFSEMIEGLNETLIGFEVGRELPSNITRKVSYALFNEINYTNALTNDVGIEQWISAYTNDTVKNDLINEFNLTQTQMNMILYWLFEESFQENVVPELMKLPPPVGLGKNITELAKELLLEQWVNGTVNGMVLYPYGFPLSLKAGTVYGFEIGYQSQTEPVIPTNMSLASAKALWNLTSEYSLVNKKGVKKWYFAVSNPNSTIASELKIANSLVEGAFTMILAWLPKFRDHVMPYLAQEDMNLPMDSTKYGNTIEIGMSIAGGLSIGLATFGLVGSIIFRKRKLRPEPS